MKEILNKINEMIKNNPSEIIIIGIFCVFIGQLLIFWSMKKRYQEEKSKPNLTEVLEKERDLLKARLEPLEKSLFFLNSRIDGVNDFGRQMKDFINYFRSPNYRGNWGEFRLKRVLELAGLLKYCNDFDEQPSVDNLEGTKSKPDIVLNLPNGISIVIDAKTPAGILKGELTPEELVKIVRNHIKILSDRRYHELFKSPTFVIMFIPSEAALVAVLEKDPSILEFDSNIILASPFTLLCILRTLAMFARYFEFQKDAAAVFDNIKSTYSAIEPLLKEADSLHSEVDRIHKNSSKFKTLIEKIHTNFQQLVEGF